MEYTINHSEHEYEDDETEGDECDNGEYIVIGLKYISNS